MPRLMFGTCLVRFSGGTPTILIEIFMVFFSTSVPENAGMVPRNWPLQLSPTFSIYRPLIIEPLDSV